jgi:hypothetical protein
VSALEELFWRDEILQALFWMRGEGLVERVTPLELARFLAVDEVFIAGKLAGLEANGYLERLASQAGSAPTFRLTPLGVQEGGRSFKDEFAGLTAQAHGECRPGCWCHDPEREGEPCPNLPKPEPDRVPA